MFHELLWRTNGARHEVATTVWTDAMEFGVHTVHAECAFISADAGVRAVGREVPVAAFTIRSEFEHGWGSFWYGNLPVCLRSLSFAGHFSPPRGQKMVRPRGLEPPRVSPLPPQGSASTNSATAACHLRMLREITGHLRESNPSLHTLHG
jgi:hypothetical protein